jgi:isopenicillin N synthase-like dioxygenase
VRSCPCSMSLMTRAYFLHPPPCVAPAKRGKETSSSWCPLNLCCTSAVLDEYVAAVRRMTCTVLQLMAQGLGLDDRDVFSRLVLDRDSDSMLRVNHYPPAAETRRLTGFGEHTDPQIISVLRSNDASGLEITLRDGTWVSVPSDTESFFVNVGDALQVILHCYFIIQYTHDLAHQVVTFCEAKRACFLCTY